MNLPIKISLYYNLLNLTEDRLVKKGSLELVNKTPLKRLPIALEAGHE
jgi:hypothetical protein